MFTESDIKKQLNIENFKNISEEQFINLVDLIPKMDKDVLINILEKLPSFEEAINKIYSQFNLMIDKILKENKEISDKAIFAYQKAMDSFIEKLNNDTTLNSEEKKYFAESIKEMADKIHEIQKENKGLFKKIIENGTFLIVILGASLLMAPFMVGDKNE